MIKKNNSPIDFYSRFRALPKFEGDLTDYNEETGVKHEIIDTGYPQDFITWNEPKLKDSLVEVEHPVMIMDLLNTKGLVALIEVTVIKNNRWRTSYAGTPLKIRD
jgi:hypothetical protein